MKLNGLLFAAREGFFHDFKGGINLVSRQDITYIFSEIRFCKPIDKNNLSVMVDFKDGVGGVFHSKRGCGDPIGAHGETLFTNQLTTCDATAAIIRIEATMEKLA